MNTFFKPLTFYGILFLVISSIFFIMSMQGNATPDKYDYFGVVILSLAWALIPALIVAGLYYWEYMKLLKIIFIVLNIGIILFFLAGETMSGASSSVKSSSGSFL